LTVKENGETQDELMLAIQVELDEIVSKEVCDTVYESASYSLQKRSQAELDAECKVRKGAIMNVVSSSVCLQRLYFIIRSSIMGAITGLLTYLIISIFSITNFFSLVVLGLFTFAVSLLLSRFLDVQIIRISNLILKYLDRYQRARAFILNRL
jgi:VIT1/CCC1 family predicted Fe2+/Mn2+ transporter